jgi:rsbT co-antagonist protein RsbR
MAALQNSTFDAMKNKQSQLLSEWINGLEASGATCNLKDHDLQQQTSEFLQLVINGLQDDNGTHINAPGWEATRQFLEKLSHSRALLGQDSQQTASFIFALKGPLFALLQSHYREQPALLAEQLWEISELFDAFGMHTIRTFQKSREAVIKRQQEELLEL